MRMKTRHCAIHAACYDLIAVQSILVYINLRHCRPHVLFAKNLLTREHGDNAVRIANYKVQRALSCQVAKAEGLDSSTFGLQEDLNRLYNIYALINTHISMIFVFIDLLLSDSR